MASHSIVSVSGEEAAHMNCNSDSRTFKVIPTALRAVTGLYEYQHVFTLDEFQPVADLDTVVLEPRPAEAEIRL